MNAALPDVSVTDEAHQTGALEWVGMADIDLPITLVEPVLNSETPGYRPGYRPEAHAKVDAQVDLPLAHVKGIHMSRLYLLLDTLTSGAALNASTLHTILQQMIDSHQDCGSQQARLGFRFDLLARRPALKTTGLSGWKAYPVTLEARLSGSQFSLTAEVKVGYSSTCPCSAALSRQILEQAFRQAFGSSSTSSTSTLSSAEPAQTLTLDEVAHWLRQQGSVATPHSQRSEAKVRVTLPTMGDSLELLALIERIEQALGTPLQTAVKRADEQAFAELNGQNLMFVEDAARAIQTALEGHYDHSRVDVCHLESLHPHDAVASAVTPNTFELNDAFGNLPGNP
ncbi:MAG: GTP cyclohydrolase FolE2 [Oceanobacter sp.]